MNWKHKFNIKEDWEKANKRKITAKQFSEIIVNKIRNSTFYSERDIELNDILMEFEGLGAEDSFDDFDVIWESFYNYADKNSIWVELF